MMQDAEIILTKNRVLRKIQLVLESVQEAQTAWAGQHGSGEIFSTPPKISRGENYLGLPWLTLDYPRVSGGGDLFFIRSMFWWGRSFSSTLHVAGKFREEVRRSLLAAYPSLGQYAVSVNTDPWVHHFETSNYLPIRTISESSFENYSGNNDFLKIARCWGLEEWPEAPVKLMESWEFLLKVSGSIPQSVK